MCGSVPEMIWDINFVLVEKWKSLLTTELLRAEPLLSFYCIAGTTIPVSLLILAASHVAELQTPASLAL